MTLLLRLATDWRPYAYLAFTVLLLLADPVARGVIACSAAKAPGGCPVGVGR